MNLKSLQKHVYTTFVASGDTTDELASALEAQLDMHAQRGYKFKTCRRIQESPFYLLVIMYREVQ